MTKPLIVGISGASGIVYGIKVLELLREMEVPVHLVVSKSAFRTLAEETSLTASELQNLAAVTHAHGNIGASIASGSFQTLGMLIVPCSVKTMSEIATGVTSNLIARAADVTLKERRRCVLAVRETPFHSGHLETMLKLTHMGAVIMPPLPAFYTRPQTLDEMVTQTASRFLESVGLEPPSLKRWSGSAEDYRP